jgi:hypothetical protein
MPLSEHEQRLLEQIEQGLYAEDPKFASTVRRVNSGSRGRRRYALAALGVVLGFGVVMLALVVKQPIVGVLGFVLIVGACAYAMTGSRRSNAVPDGPMGVVDAAGSTRPRRQSGMKERMEDRLRRRFDEE